VYNSKGRREKDINLNVDDRFIIDGRLIQSPSGELLLAGFHSNASKKEDLNGFFINKIDGEKGELKLSSFKEINPAMLSTSFQEAGEEDDETKENKKMKEKLKDDDDQDEFPNSYVIKSVDVNPVDNSILITGEVSKYSYYSYTTSSYNSMSKTWSYRTTYVHQFVNKDILVINADANGNIRWINNVPKSQLEEIRTSSGSSTGFSMSNDFSNYFANGGGMPYYSSYSKLLTKTHLILVMNDHESNNVLGGYGDKVKTIYNFKKKSNAYAVAIDLATGKMAKKMIAANTNDQILTPRHAFVAGNDVYMPSWRAHAMAKTELKFAKLSVK